MYKQIKNITAVLLVGLFIGVSFVQAEYTLTVGDVFTYKVEKSEWYYIVGDNQTSGFGFYFNDVKFANDELITATVTSVEMGIVEFEIEIGEESGSYILSIGFAFGFNALIKYPFDMLIGAMFWMIDGEPMYLELKHMYYIPTNMDEIFELLTNETYLAEEFLDDEQTSYSTLQGTFNDLNEIAVFTWQMDCHYVNENENADYAGTYTLEIEYYQSTGLLNRYFMDFDYSGIYESQTVDLYSKQEVELQENTSTSESTGFTGAVTLPVLIALGLLYRYPLRKKC